MTSQEDFVEEQMKAADARMDMREAADLLARSSEDD